MDELTPQRDTRTLLYSMLMGFEGESVTFINWELVTKKGNNALKDGEKANLFEMIAAAHKEGMPASMQQYMDSCDNKDRGRALKILAELTSRTGFNSALATVDEAIRFHATDPDSLESLYRRIYSEVPIMPPISASELPSQKIIPFRNELKELDALLMKGGASNG